MTAVCNRRTVNLCMITTTTMMMIYGTNISSVVQDISHMVTISSKLVVDG